jgi:hypothetical protein
MGEGFISLADFSYGCIGEYIRIVSEFYELYGL